METTFFEVALKCFANTDDDFYTDFEYSNGRGTHKIRISTGGVSKYYEFDDDVVDQLNKYLGAIYDEYEPIYEDMEEFLMDAFFECLEEIIDDSVESDWMVDNV